ncbi:MAG: phage tail sheath family protein [Halioglobus sp.]|nr:phage tail sheath family protein [Halioglobus sp.]
MPKYRTPGVDVGQPGSRVRSIGGVSTSTVGFIGPCHGGPVGSKPELLHSQSDFERIYGPGNPLHFSDTAGPVHNYLSLAVRAFFQEGGTGCYVARVVNGIAGPGGDGGQPRPADYEGTATLVDGVMTKTGLRSFEELDDIAIVAAPGSSFACDSVGGSCHAEAIAQALISHCEKMRYRTAVLDSVHGHDTGAVQAYRGRFDSQYAALYYPWIVTADPLSGNSIEVPPSGAVCGIYARVDRERGVHKAPANEVIRSATGLSVDIDRRQQAILNPLGINCLRYFGRRGYRIWGARTVSSDPEWKYINVRRHVAYLQHSIERGTRYAALENNGAGLWAAIRQSIGEFLDNEWRRGRFAGARPEEAFFVRCDRSTMTQHDIDTGRLVCEVGVAPVKPAEFVMFRIGQKTALPV